MVVPITAGLTDLLLFNHRKESNKMFWN